MNNVVADKSFEFAVRTVNLCKYLKQEKKEYTISNQLLRCGTSIGANISEAQRGQSTADFASKMSIALKEAYETEYWLRLLYRTEYICEKEYGSIHPEILELIRILVSICKAVNNKK